MTRSAEASISRGDSSGALSTLLSQVLIAYTIEHDNEFERLMMASPYQPFLVSLVMWSNFMRFVPVEGITVRELSAAAGLSTKVHPSLPGMERWGYVKVHKAEGDLRPKPPQGELVIKPGLAGQKAQEIWQGLSVEIENRWRERFGDGAVGHLQGSLRTMMQGVAVTFPDYLPVLMSKDLKSSVEEWDTRQPSGDSRLVTLLAQTLFAFTLDYEKDAEVSLPLAANVIRVLREEGCSVRDLPQMTGVSKEAVSMSLTFLEKNDYVSTGPAQNGGRGKWVRLTTKGRSAQSNHHERLGLIEADWISRSGEAVRQIREALEQVIEHPRFSEALMPSPNGWRAKKPYLERTEAFLSAPRGALPYHPMVLHRGGWPDGS